MDSYSHTKSAIQEMMEGMENGEDDEALNVGGYRPKFESQHQPMEDLAQLEIFSRNYKNLLDRMNVVTHDIGDLFIPIAPDGCIPNSNLRSNIYAWLYRKGLVDKLWRNDHERAAQEEAEEKEKTENMHKSRDYRHKLLKLLSSLPNNIVDNSDPDLNYPVGPNFQKRRMTRMNALSPKAREMIRQRLSQQKNSGSIESTRPSSRGNAFATTQRKDSYEEEVLPQYIKKALDDKIFKEDQVRIVLKHSFKGNIPITFLDL